MKDQAVVLWVFSLSAGSFTCISRELTSSELFAHVYSLEFGSIPGELPEPK